MTDNVGCVHSIDNLIIDFVVKSFNSRSVLDMIQKVFEKHVPNWPAYDSTQPYKNGRVDNLKHCHKYQFFNAMIYGGGFDFWYGQWRKFDRTYYSLDGKTAIACKKDPDSDWTIHPILRLKVNPNKYANTPLWADVWKLISEECDSGVIVKFDYAVDVPAPPKDVLVYSRKEFGLTKGTRYYGQRGRHGHLKVYDKAVHCNLDYPLTRVEWKFACNQPISFDEVRWLTNGPAPLPDVSELSSRTYTLCWTGLKIRSIGSLEDVLEYLDRLDIRTRKKIEPYTIGSGAQLLGSDCEILVKLLEYYCNAHSLSFSSGGVNSISVGRFAQPSWDYLDDDDDGLPL